MKYILLCYILTTSSLTLADEALSLLMQQLKSSVPIQLTYKESRTLELMDEVWLGSGYLYAIPPNIMIREQLKPKHLLMGVIDDRMYYFDPESDTHYNTEFDQDSPRTLSIAVFKALINADEKLLHTLYKVDFSSSPQTWKMLLKPKQNTDSPLRIIVSGLAGQQANTFHITQEAGETSQFSLQKHKQGEQLKKVIDPMLKVLIGK